LIAAVVNLTGDGVHWTRAHAHRGELVAVVLAVPRSQNVLVDVVLDRKGATSSLAGIRLCKTGHPERCKPLASGASVITSCKRERAQRHEGESVGATHVDERVGQTRGRGAAERLVPVSRRTAAAGTVQS